MHKRVSARSAKWRGKRRSRSESFATIRRICRGTLIAPGLRRRGTNWRRSDGGCPGEAEMNSSGQWFKRGGKNQKSRLAVGKIATPLGGALKLSQEGLALCRQEHWARHSIPGVGTVVAVRGERMRKTDRASNCTARLESEEAEVEAARASGESPRQRKKQPHRPTGG